MGTAIWHFCANCSSWPRAMFDVTMVPPESATVRRLREQAAGRELQLTGQVLALATRYI